MSHIEFIFGPAYSGKSKFAFNELDTNLPTSAIMFSPPEVEATMQLMFQQSATWKSAQQLIFDVNPQNLNQALQDALQKSNQIIVDGINLWCVQEIIKTSKIYSQEHLIEHMNTEIKNLLLNCKTILDSSQEVSVRKKIIFVSNEVGAGVVPERPFDRVFRLVLSQINQLLAENSGRCKFIVAGLPIHLK
ncbi:MAG: bifunctional adenosylcobinamide kinase/adenosylcobinamide-phosphate guanylyltransferase [Oligoflexales bacterium]|nr:bifunctional adenosylcobinamide kinase/adenosylcobinamide-phosphate guanylyltransferase [Oligoflexales bacterium]